MSNKTFATKVKLETTGNVNKKNIKYFVAGLLKDNVHGNRLLTIKDADLKNAIYEKITTLTNLHVTLEKSIHFIPSEIDDLINSINLNFVDLTNIEWFIAGVFVSKGSVNPPDSSSPHLEIRFKDVSNAVDVSEYLTQLRFRTMRTEKKGWIYIYIKRREDIVAFLSIIKANTNMLILQNANIIGENIHNNSKPDYAFEANVKKIIAASEKQMPRCYKVDSEPYKYNLSVQERRISELRIKNPEASLSELAEIYNFVHCEDSTICKYSKSAINHWMRNIIREVDEKN